MLVRDRPTLEVFMVRRHLGAAFGPGAYVFPGGAVDAGDRQVPFVGRTRENADTVMARAGAIDHWIAAAREAFEEAGFMLTDVTPRELLGERGAVHAGARDFASVLAAHAANVDAATMHVFSHWRTPVGAPRRFDTWFFVAAAPLDQEGAHDETETVHSEWIRPADMVARWRRGDVDLMFPTMRTLRVLARFTTASAFLDAVRTAERAAGGTAPRVVADGSGQRIALWPHEFEAAEPGWRALRSRLKVDARLEAIDRAAVDEGAA